MSLGRVRLCISWELKMVDFIYHTPDLGDPVCQWINELCRTWHSSCFLSRNDETKLWVRLDGGKRVRIKDPGSSLPEFREKVRKVLG